jgi:hypothetical protein
LRPAPGQAGAGGAVPLFGWHHGGWVLHTSNSAIAFASAAAGNGPGRMLETASGGQSGHFADLEAVAVHIRNRGE